MKQLLLKQIGIIMALCLAVPMVIPAEEGKPSGQEQAAEAQVLDEADAGKNGMDTDDEEDGYTLEQVVVLSRHNLRAPLSSNGSVPQDLTNHEWIKWTANSSELTMKGGIQETNMGQYFRKWLDKEGLIAENSIPEDGEVRW